MQIVLGHIQIRVADQTLDDRKVHPERLHLRDVGVAAGMGRKGTDTVDFSDVFLELLPVVLGIKGLLPVG